MLNWHRILLLAPATVLMIGCNSTPGVVTDSTDLDAPAFGRRDVTTFVAGTDGTPVSLQNIAAISKTIRKYKILGAGDQEILRRVAGLKLDGLIAGEMQRIAPQFEKKKAIVRQKFTAKIATVRKQAVAAGKPGAVVEQQVAAVKTGETQEMARIDLDWKAAAHAEVTKKYGTDFAVPVANPEGKAVVAFASIKDSGVSINSAAFELAGTATQLDSAARAGRKVSHNGNGYALLDAKAVLQ